MPPGKVTHAFLNTLFDLGRKILHFTFDRILPATYYSCALLTMQFGVNLYLKITIKIVPCNVRPLKSEEVSLILGRTDFYETRWRYSQMNSKCLEASFVSVAMGKLLNFDCVIGVFQCTSMLM